MSERGARSHRWTWCLLVLATTWGSGCSSKSEDPQPVSSEAPTELTDAERELFFGPLPGEELPVAQRTRQLIADLEDGVTKNEFRSVLRSLRNLGRDAIPTLGEKLDSILEDPNAPRSTAYIADNICDVLPGVTE